MRIVFKHLPLRIHTKAPAAHAAAEAAHRQGKFWEMHDAIFANQREMSPEKYVEYAAEIGLDVEQFKRDVADAEVKRKVDADAKEAAALGVTGTPGFFINGKLPERSAPLRRLQGGHRRGAEAGLTLARARRRRTPDRSRCGDSGIAPQPRCEVLHGIGPPIDLCCGFE